MAKVRMLMDVSGLRGGTAESLGDPWPQHGQILECDPGEAAQLVNAGIAERVAPPARAARTEPAAGDEPQDAGKPAETRTAPRPRAAAKS